MNRKNFFTAIFLLLSLPLSVLADEKIHVKVNLKEAGSLQDELIDTDYDRIDSLTISGKFSGVDLAYLKKRSGRLASLEFIDLTDIEIVECDEPYYSWTDIDSSIGGYGNPPVHFYSDGVIDIFRAGNSYLIRLDDIRLRLTGIATPEEIHGAVTVGYFDGDTHYLALKDVTTILGKLKGTENLIEYFKLKILMEPTPCKVIPVDFNISPCEFTNYRTGEFRIYKGEGFVENKFFARTREIAALIDGLNHFSTPNAFDEAALTAGLFERNGEKYCRLNYAGYIVRHYLARLWNGKNETNDRIVKGWAFIDWFKKFYPDFLKKHVAYVCGAIKPPDTNFEEPV